MVRRRALLVGLSAAALLATPGGWAQEKKSPEKTSEKDATTKLRIEVTGGDSADPVENASVYVKWERERRLAKDQKFEENWKTNREGVVKVPSVPHGKVLIQVVAPGWKTFGQWYDLKQEEMTIKIRLQKPTKWY